VCASERVSDLPAVAGPRRPAPGDGLASPTMAPAPERRPRDRPEQPSTASCWSRAACRWRRAGLAITPLLDDQLLVVLPAGHRLAGAPEVDLAQLSHEPWIINERCREQTLHGLRPGRVRPHRRPGHRRLPTRRAALDRRRRRRQHHNRLHHWHHRSTRRRLGPRRRHRPTPNHRRPAQPSTPLPDRQRAAGRTTTGSQTPPDLNSRGSAAALTCWRRPANTSSLHAAAGGFPRPGQGRLRQVNPVAWSVARRSADPPPRASRGSRRAVVWGASPGSCRRRRTRRLPGGHAGGSVTRLVGRWRFPRPRRRRAGR
jgi:hypothetical protein